MDRSSYAWGNFAVLALGVWAVAQRDSVDAVVMVSLQQLSFCRSVQTLSCDRCVPVLTMHVSDESDTSNTSHGPLGFALLSIKLNIC